jgi:hypothetical protein
MEGTILVVAGASILLNVYLIYRSFHRAVNKDNRKGNGFKAGEQSLVEYNAYLKMQHDRAIQQAIETAALLEQLQLEREKERIECEANKRALKTEYFNSLAEVNRLRDGLNKKIVDLKQKLAKYE